jgi:hypothetical protein
MNSGEQGNLDDGGGMPTMSSKIAREIAELQDMYRRTLAAQWSSNMDELPADKCIEDIFAGGDSLGKHGSKPSGLGRDAGDSTEDEGEKVHRHLHHRVHPSASKHPHLNRSGHIVGVGKDLQRGLKGSTHTDHGNPSSGSDDHVHRIHRKMAEVDEFEARGDLKSWEIHAR